MLIKVDGHPAPQGSKRPLGQTAGGRTRMIESSKYVKPWRDAVRTETQNQRNGEFFPAGVALQIEIYFYFQRPQRHYGTGKNAGNVRASAPEWPAGAMNDIDKLTRSTLDGLKEGGAMADDGQIVRMVVTKGYVQPGAPEGAMIEVAEMPVQHYNGRQVDRVIGV